MNSDTAQLKTDEVLVASWLAGDEAAFEAIYERYRLPVFSFLHRLLPGQRDLVDDLFQQVWTKAAANLQRYEERQKLISWLFRIAHNLVMDWFRREGKHGYQELTDNLPSAGNLPGEELCSGELEAALKAAIDCLPAEQQQVVRGRLQGVSFLEIAKQSGIPLNTALGRMHYAVANLRRALKDYL